jgi:hypothetical protein
MRQAGKCADPATLPVLAARIAERRASRGAVHRGLLGRLGPGLIIGASGDDPSGIAIYSETEGILGVEEEHANDMRDLLVVSLYGSPDTTRDQASLRHALALKAILDQAVPGPCCRSRCDQPTRG